MLQAGKYLNGNKTDFVIQRHLNKVNYIRVDICGYPIFHDDDYRLRRVTPSTLADIYHHWRRKILHPSSGLKNEREKSTFLRLFYQSTRPQVPIHNNISSLTLRRRIKSHLLFAGIIRSSPFSPR